MTQKERMLAGLPYKAWMDGLPEERARAQRACWEFNRLPPDARAERTALLRGLFGGADTVDDLRVGQRVERSFPLGRCKGAVGQQAAVKGAVFLYNICPEALSQLGQQR